MKQNQPLSLSDLEDLSDWRIAPILTIEQAALLWGGIDPAFCHDFSDAARYHPAQVRRAVIARQAFLGGIALKTLTVHELYLFNWNGEPYKAEPNNADFTFEDIDTKRTTVMTQVLTAWAKRQGCTSLRQALQQKEKDEKEQARRKEFDEWVEAENKKEAESKQPLKIEYLPYKPKHDNPRLETAIEISREVYDPVKPGERPPKSFVTTELIEQKMTAKTGVKPTANEIRQIDATARPEIFKNRIAKKEA